jgi:hypothetical protein
MKNCLYILTLGLLLGTLFLTACQSDALPYEDNGQPLVCGTDSCYLNLQIVDNTKPTTRATIAATNAENAVFDGILCIFEGSDEATATLKTAVAIDQLIKNPGSTNDPQTMNITQRLAGTHHYNGKKLYVLALLNTTLTGFTLSGNTLKFDDTSLTGNTISQIQTLQIKSVGSTDEHVGLFMSNAPQTGYIMPEVTSSYLFDTPAAAAAGSRLTINVERAAAKVKVNTPTPAPTLYIGKYNGESTSNTLTVHRMTWALHNYNKVSYAIRNGYTAAENWATSAAGEGIPIAFVNSGTDAFDLYKQLSFSDGESVYIAENTSSAVNDQTQVFVEVQLKEGSFLLGDCYKYELWGNVIFFTSAEKFIQYCKAGWKDTFSQNSAYTIIKDKSADEVFKYYSFVINNNGTVTVTITNNSFTNAEKAGLSSLSSILSGTLKGYRDGKMYFTYKIKHDNTPTYGVVRNNAYNLTFTGVPGIGDPVPTPIVTP